MKKTKTQKGITLLALVITIVVLLILAGVAINSITSTNLIDQASAVGQKWNEAQGNESTTLGGYESEIDKQSANLPITFTIDGVQYTAKRGETWENWVKNNSKFSIAPNTANVVVSSSYNVPFYTQVLFYRAEDKISWHYPIANHQIIDGMNYEIFEYDLGYGWIS